MPYGLTGVPHWRPVSLGSANPCSARMPLRSILPMPVRRAGLTTGSARLMRGKINNIVTPESVAKAALVLTNAVYFKGAWEAPFPASSTVNASFHMTVADKSVPMMHNGRIGGAYRSGALGRSKARCSIIAVRDFFFMRCCHDGRDAAGRWRRLIRRASRAATREPT